MNNKTIFITIKEYALSILVAIGFAFVFHSYVFARADVTGPSMQPTFNDRDVIFVEKVSTEIGHINRSEIVIFNSKNQNNDTYIKRVIGIAGDKIDIKDGKVYLNGQAITESYLPQGTITEPNSFNTEYVIPKGYIFVLGDNRGNSTDSRILGLINIKDVKGHVIFRAYPFKNISIF
ncbi:signal peptidase I [Clostridium sp. WILCCON 0269]|uniref:Signal peptidase I n=1 Tax=Candidatus Clostridium eludens TaxID=3381663 RepID=A0ABW8SN50_9CLOT